MIKYCCSLILEILLVGMANAQDSLNVIRIGFAQLPSACSRITLSGDFAYVAGDSLYVVDISDPANPVVVGRCDPLGSPYNIAASGSYAYLANHVNNLRVVDASNPESPFDLGGFLTGLVVGVAVSASHAYVGVMDAGLRVLDISNPANPDSIGACDLSGHPIGIAISGSFLYSAWSHQAYPGSITGLQIVDISNPTAPSVVGGINFGLGSGGEVSVSGDYAYLNFAGQYAAEIFVVDVSHPANPIWAGSCVLPGYINGLAASDSFVYVADGAFGLQVVDVSNPVNPIQAGYYCTQGDAQDVAVSGTYAYVAEGNYFGIYEFTPPTFTPNASPVHLALGFDLNVSPNPFNPATVLSYQLPAAGNISLEVFDISGRKLVELASGFHLPGEYRYVWDASGRAAGMYFMRLRAGEEEQFEKLMLLK